MNLSDDKRRFQRGDSGAGDGLGTVAHAGPAHSLTVGAVGFDPEWTMEDSMAASIVRLEQELEEANARIAVLEEEQKILAKGFPSPAKAAVIEGVEQQDLLAGVSRIGCHERPEPSPHFIDTPKTYESDTPETCEAVERWQQGKINIFDEMARLERERDEARIQYRSTEALGMALVKTIDELKAERAELKATIESLRDQLCADKCRDKAAADGGWANI